MTDQALMSIGQILPDVQAAPLPPDRNPAAVYLARLAPGSRPTMMKALDTIARFATGGALDAERRNLELKRADVRLAEAQLSSDQISLEIAKQRLVVNQQDASRAS